MKKLHKFGLVIIIIGLMFIGVLARFGWFAEVVIVEESVPAMTAIIASHQGQYSTVGPLMGTLYEDGKAAGIKSTVGLGIYFDDPEVTEIDSLRAIVGMEISDSDRVKCDSLNEQYRIIELPEMTAQVARFPYNGQFSILVAVMRVYPELKKRFADEVASAPIIEIYDIPNNEIRFVVPTNLSQEITDGWLTADTAPVDSVAVEIDSMVVDSTAIEVIDTVL